MSEHESDNQVEGGTSKPVTNEQPYTAAAAAEIEMRGGTRSKVERTDLLWSQLQQQQQLAQQQQSQQVAFKFAPQLPPNANQWVELFRTSLQEHKDQSPSTSTPYPAGSSSSPVQRTPTNQK